MPYISHQGYRGGKDRNPCSQGAHVMGKLAPGTLLFWNWGLFLPSSTELDMEREYVFEEQPSFGQAAKYR